MVRKCAQWVERRSVCAKRNRVESKKHTFVSGARSMARCSSMSLLSVSAPAFSRTRAASPWPSEIAKYSYLSRRFSVLGVPELNNEVEGFFSLVRRNFGRVED